MFISQNLLEVLAIKPYFLQQFTQICCVLKIERLIFSLHHVPFRHGEISSDMSSTLKSHTTRPPFSYRSLIYLGDVFFTESVLYFLRAQFKLIKYDPVRLVRVDKANLQILEVWFFANWP